MSADNQNKCCLCGDEAKVDPVPTHHLISHFKCVPCGEFFVHQIERRGWLDDRAKREKAFAGRLSALTREQMINHLPPLLLQFDKSKPLFHGIQHAYPVYVEELLQSRWPETVSERLDRALCNLVHLSPESGHKLPWAHKDPPLLFAVSVSEAVFFKKALEERGDIQGDSQQGFFVAPDGWERYAELKRSTGNRENPVFVAMWFGDRATASTLNVMDDLYRDGIAPAIEEAGYRHTRSDIEPHNDYIMNKILGDIRIAPFVVADFTSNRNGVYFEAGFARGLGIPVVHTCKRSDFDKAHFDTRQLSHILWETPAQLRQALSQHIRGTMGEGPKKR